MEDKHDEAAPMAASDRSPTAGNDGNYDGCERRHRALLGLGFPREGERQVRGERGKQRASWQDMLRACPPELGLPFQSDHQSEDDKLY